jgi:hydrogenase maturation protease
MRPSGALLIGVGQEQRGDDAVGLLVARHVAASTADAIDVVEHGGDGMDLMLAWEGADHVVLVDAVVSGTRAPGGVARFDAHEAPLPARIFAAQSTHALGVAEAIEMARALDRLPPRVVVYGVEAECFDTGSEPGPAVRAAVAPVAARVLAELGLASGREGAAHA